MPDPQHAPTRQEALDSLLQQLNDIRVEAERLCRVEDDFRTLLATILSEANRPHIHDELLSMAARLDERHYRSA